MQPSTPRPALATCRPAVRTVERLLETAPGAPDIRADLSDYAVNMLREAADASGWSRADLAGLLSEEQGRLAPLPPTTAGLWAYLRCSRVGSCYRLTRSARACIFGAAAARAIRG